MGAIKLVTVGLDFNFYKIVKSAAKNADVSVSQFVRSCLELNLKKTRGGAVGGNE